MTTIYKNWDEYLASEQEIYLDPENAADNNVNEVINGYTVSGFTVAGAYEVYRDHELVCIITTNAIAEADQFEDVTDTISRRLWKN